MTGSYVRRGKLFISHSSHDAAWAERVRSEFADRYNVFLDAHPEDGLYPGPEWARQLWEELRVSSCVVVLASNAWLRSRWCVAEAIIAEHFGVPIVCLDAVTDADPKASLESRAAPDLLHETGEPDALPRLESILPSFLTKQRVILAHGTPDEHRTQLDRGVDKAIGHMPALPRDAAPWRGLQPYDREHAALFFGRDYEIRRVLATIETSKRTSRVVVVVGASGSGKSSLVRAGVLPTLERRQAAASWVVIAPIVAGGGVPELVRKLESAASRVSDTPLPRDLVDGVLAGGDDQWAAESLSRLADQVIRHANSESAHLLVTVDQLEEVFRGRDGSSAQRMLSLLLRVCNDPEARLAMLATLRSDSLDDFQQLDVVARLGDEHGTTPYHAVTLDPMARSGRRQVIEGPADRFGIRLEVGLADMLLDDAAAEDALPLLSVAMLRLYKDYGADSLLEISEYERLFANTRVAHARGDDEVTGVAGAVTSEAEEALRDAGIEPDHFDVDDERQLRSLFLRFVEVTERREAGQDRRRNVPVDQLPDDDLSRRVIDAFVEHRLLVSKRIDGETHLTVAHEALFRVWPRLARWIEANREALIIRSRVKRAATEWRERGSRDVERWTASRAVDVYRLLRNEGALDTDRLSDEEVTFLGPLDERAVIAALDDLDALDDHTVRLNERADLGFRLSLIGDHRPGVGVEDGLPDIDWLPVPGGEVHLVDVDLSDPANKRELSRLAGGSVPDPGSRTQRRHLLPQQMTATVAPFRISRYPITNGQYAAFATSKHYDRAQWWGGRQPPRRNDRPDMPSNYPATHLSFFEAVAFCNWLSAEQGVVVRLPTEFEWQQAATLGDETYEYPWGREPLGGRSNSFTQRVQTSSYITPTTTAVGMFPRGASPVGALDMSGNCWEWCDSVFDPTSDVDEPERVVRGGSWIIGMPFCRAVYAGSLSPISDGLFVGFRPIQSDSPTA